MEDIKGFVNDLREMEFKTVVVDTGECNCFVDIDDLQKEIEEKFGIKEIIDTYCEDLSFISSNGELIEIHGFY